MTRRKAAPPTFTQRHAESISKLKLVLIVVCLIAIPSSFWLTHEDVGSVNNRVTKIESPCKRFGPDSKVCQKAFETAVKSITHRIACYIDHESGRPFKPSCIGVHLRIETPVPKLGNAVAQGRGDRASSSEAGGGDATSSPSTGHSQPGRHEGGSGHETDGATDTPSHPHAPSVPDQSPKGGDSGGNEAPAASTGPVPSSSPAPASSSTSTTERSAETPVVEPAPEPQAPVGAAVGGLVGSVGAMAEGLGETATGTVEDAESTTCQLAKVLCGE